MFIPHCLALRPKRPSSHPSLNLTNYQLLPLRTHLFIYQQQAFCQSLRAAYDISVNKALRFTWLPRSNSAVHGRIWPYCYSWYIGLPVNHLMNRCVKSLHRRAAATIAMPGTVSAEKVHRALLKFITDGSFPESESITEADYPVTALPAGIEQISEARQRVEVWDIFDERLRPIKT